MCGVCGEGQEVGVVDGACDSVCAVGGHSGIGRCRSLGAGRNGVERYGTVWNGIGFAALAERYSGIGYPAAAVTVWIRHANRTSLEPVYNGIGFLAR